MKRISLLVLLAALALSLATASARGSGSGSLVVAEVYSAGGNSGAAYANDYVELFNRGAAAVAVDGWTLQYASAASTSWQSTALSGSIPAGGRYLVQLASGGANGAALPTADATGTSNLAVTGGKVALVNGATALSCGASAGSCSAVSGVEDLVGYGSAADYEGSGAAPAGSATNALMRAGGGLPTPTTTRRTSPLRRPILRTRPGLRARARRRRLPTERAHRRPSTSTSSRFSPSRSTTRR